MLNRRLRQIKCIDTQNVIFYEYNGTEMNSLEMSWFTANSGDDNFTFFYKTITIMQQSDFHIKLQDATCPCTFLPETLSIYPRTDRRIKPELYTWKAHLQE